MFMPLKKSKKKNLSRTKKPKRKFTHHPDHYNRSEPYLIDPLGEDLKDAWFKLRAYGESLGAQTIYASGRAIMFSRKTCYFFVRPKKSFLEVVVFLTKKRPMEFYKTIRPVSKTKLAHTYRLIHSDQVEGELTEAISLAYDEVPHNIS